MSFTFDDIGHNVPVSKSNKLDQLTHRIERLRARAGNKPEIQQKIAAMEHRRQVLLNKHSYGMVPPELEPTAAEDGRVGDAGNVANATAEIQQRADRRLGGFTRVGVGRRNFRIR